MPLEGLLELVETLRDRIDQHGAALRQSEALTRYALIDPLLRELGWDTADPDVVMPEYRVPNNQIADYVLLSEKQPVIVVESKKLDEPLSSGKALDQGILYCAHTGSKYFLLTDGRLWEIYESGSTTPIVRFDLRSQSAAEVCLKALALWRPSVESGQIGVGRTPVVGLPQEQSGAVHIQTTSVEEPAVQPMSVVNTPAEEGWLPLSDFIPQTGDKAPSEIVFPDRSTIQIRIWKSIMVEVTRWLVNNRLIGLGHCPIGIPGARRRYIVNTAPKHPSGEQFRTPEQVDSLHIETHANSKTIVQHTQHIIEVAGQDPAEFWVRVP